MRKFIGEDNETILTIKDLWLGWLAFEYAEEFTFSEYLENCMTRNNGTLDEILTDETPAENLRDSVILCQIIDEEDEEDEWMAFLTKDAITRQRCWGRKVILFDGNSLDSVEIFLK